MESSVKPTKRRGMPTQHRIDVSEVGVYSKCGLFTQTYRSPLTCLCLDSAHQYWFQTIRVGKNSTWVPAKTHAPLCFGAYVAARVALRRLSLVASSTRLDCRLVTVPCPPRWVTTVAQKVTLLALGTAYIRWPRVLPARLRRAAGQVPGPRRMMYSAANNGADDRGLALLALTRS